MNDYIYIPPSEGAAKRHLERAMAGRLEMLLKMAFMKAYCSVAYLYPGFHPDDLEGWDGPAGVVRFAREAWRRAGLGELSDNELYPYQASKARVRQARGRM